MTTWAPSVRTIEDDLSPWPVQAMQALLDHPPNARAGDPLPLGWHWLFFHEAVPSSALGVDGHPARGGFLPPVDAPRRMWAGGRLHALEPVILGQPATLVSKVRSVERKTGRSGPLTFVRVVHEVHQQGVSVEEEQVLVYRERESPRAVEVEEVAPRKSPDPAWSRPFTPTRVTLFQFSALTYNAHRIHYDYPYATEREGYADLLVHAPLTVLALLDAAAGQGSTPTSFRYRALAPLFVDQTAVLEGFDDGTLRAVSNEGLTLMEGTVTTA